MFRISAASQGGRKSDGAHGDSGTKDLEHMKKSVENITYWVPFLFAVALSGISLHGMSQSSVPLPPGLLPFLAFIPMAFFFSAINTQKHISRLEKRIEALEKKAGAAKDSILN
jgi:hypothetical protein